ncbi:hypothetical protein SAMD00019534_063930 [Acytostelium subglobosum LB1]|uniref:hypothetical protein n=1 Tax=Acytostelium subglobosum LB1 TaxID=1410327 RepID=UPI0006449F13|nr:hypothetical protein SAMD00019534_063930 [Acytostelium subglobosum LB1]GAM23218.1 hypothetical protein SAMD00019534_063930 [Acytostelium subglobosum LB1]|eukprot:XP_012753667.1 hypothetical protein SAMD00019534_063930 [Acytostelium subglobosum LB1]
MDPFQDNGHKHNKQQQQQQLINDDDDVENGEEDDVVICGENLQAAIKVLISAHSKDVLKIEREFQRQKNIWSEEKTKLIQYTKRLKEKNRLLIQIIKEHGLQQQQGHDVVVVDDTLSHPPAQQQQCTVISSTTMTTKTTTSSMTSSTKSVDEEEEQDEMNEEGSEGSDDGFSDFRPKRNSLKKGEDQGSSTTDNKQKNKKRKSSEPSNEVNDDLDLPLVNDRHLEEEEELRLLQSSQPGKKTPMMANKYGDNGASRIVSPTPSTGSSNGNQKKYKYREVVRNKAEREKLKGFECDHCKEFYKAVLGDDFDQKMLLLNQCSRHRQQDETPPTPPGYWDFNFGDESDNDEQKHQQQTQPQPHHNIIDSSF